MARRTIRKLHEGTWYELRPAANGVFYIHWSEERRSRRQSTRQKEVAAAQAFLDGWLSLAGAPAEVLTCEDIFRARYREGSDEVRFVWANLSGTFGAKRPAEVTQKLVDDYIASRRAGRIGRKPAAPSTIRREIANLYASWTWAADRKRAMLSPADLPALDPPPPPSPPRERWLRDKEIDKLMAAAAAHERVALFLWLALDTAGRRTAICELTWSQIDFEAGIVHLNPEGREQTRKRRASVPMSNRLRGVLTRAYETRTNDLVLGTTSRINGPLRKVVADSGVAGVTPHVLRHTAATHMARRGVSIWIIAKILGITVEVAEKTYAKYAPDFGREAVEAIGGAVVRPRAVGGE